MPEPGRPASDISPLVKAARLRPAFLLSLALLAAAPAARGQSVDGNLDENGSPKQAGADQGYAAAARALPRIVVPVAKQQGLELPARINITGHAGTISVELPAPEQPHPPPPPPPHQGLWTALSAGLLTLSVLLWAWVKRRVAETPVPVAAPPPAPGAELSSNFAIVRAIGAGGMGVVYEARDRTLDRRVAIKRMRGDIRESPSDAQTFLKEAKTVAALHHPNIVDIHSVVAQGPEVYLVFEFVEGRTVEELLRERGRLSLAETKAILCPVCQALDFAHERNIIHRDLKPGNVMINLQGLVKVMDFGIARRVRAPSGEGERLPSKDGGPLPAERNRPEETRTIIGTPLYMSPEAEAGLVCRESDIYALGVMTYRMLTGRLPYPESAGLGQKLTRDYAQPAALVPGLPAGVDALVDAALEPDYAKRIHSAREFWARLAAL